MKAYSSDLRQKIIDAYENKEGSIRQLAQRFKVSPKFVHDLLQRYRNEGTIDPKPHAGGSAPRLQDEDLRVLQELVEQDNDATLKQLADQLFERTQIRVSSTTIHRALNKLNLTRKKRLSKPAKLRLSECKNCALTTGKRLRRLLQKTWCSWMRLA